MTFHNKRWAVSKGQHPESWSGNNINPRVNATVSAEYYARIVALAAERQVPVATVLRDALDAYLAPHRPQL